MQLAEENEKFFATSLPFCTLIRFRDSLMVAGVSEPALKVSTDFLKVETIYCLGSTRLGINCPILPAKERLNKAPRNRLQISSCRRLLFDTSPDFSPPYRNKPQAFGQEKTGAFPSSR